MMSFLANLVNFVANCFQNAFYFASSVGQLIVILITTIVTVIYNIIGNFLTFFQIVYEDNKSLFVEELPNWTFSFIDGLTYQCGQINEFLLHLFNRVFSELYALLSCIKWIFETIFIIVGDLCFILKKTFVLLGDTLWFVLTFIPVHLPYLIKEVIQKIKESIVNHVIDMYMALLRVTNFLSDVPFESFMGIILAVVIVRLCIFFRMTLQTQINNLYWTCIRKVLFMYHHIHNYFTDSEVRVIAQIAEENAIARRSQNIDDDTDVASDALCVICQERQKCVLTLPCRHVCLCSECCMRLYGYQRTCPICRTFIYHSVTIYM